MYRFADGSYQGEADLVEQMTHHDGVVTFTGIWHDPQGDTGEWDVYIEFEKDRSIYTFTYDEAKE